MDFLANLSTIDESRPTLFELIAQDQLRDLLQPAIRYVLVFYAQRYPRYLLRIANNSEELYALLMSVVESYFLREYHGSFTENFYGLKRERALRVPTLPRTSAAAHGSLKKVVSLRLRDRVWTVLFLVGIPYAKAKLDEQWELHGSSHAILDGPRHPQALAEDANWRQRMRYYSKRTFRASYPAVNAAYYLSSLYFNLAYMFGSSNYPSASHAILRQRVRRLDGEDYRRIEESTQRGIELPPNSSLSPLVFLRVLLPKGISALKYILPLGIFFLKFLEWWQSSDFAAQLARKTSSSIELPPPAPLPLSETAKESQNRKECRLCGRAIVNPTAIQTGFVFCYVCAYKWVKESSRCPVSGQTLLNGVDGLRRLVI